MVAPGQNSGGGGGGGTNFTFEEIPRLDSSLTGRKRSPSTSTLSPSRPPVVIRHNVLGYGSDNHGVGLGLGVVGVSTTTAPPEERYRRRSSSIQGMQTPTNEEKMARRRQLESQASSGTGTGTGTGTGGTGGRRMAAGRLMLTPLTISSSALAPSPTPTDPNNFNVRIPPLKQAPGTPVADESDAQACNRNEVHEIVLANKPPALREYIQRHMVDDIAFPTALMMPMTDSPAGSSSSSSSSSSGGGGGSGSVTVKAESNQNNANKAANDSANAGLVAIDATAASVSGPNVNANTKGAGAGAGAGAGKLQLSVPHAIVSTAGSGGVALASLKPKPQVLPEYIKQELGAPDIHGWTPLMMAASLVNQRVATTMCGILLDARVCPDSTDRHGLTALHWAAAVGNDQVRYGRGNVR